MSSITSAEENCVELPSLCECGYTIKVTQDDVSYEMGRYRIIPTHGNRVHLQCCWCKGLMLLSDTQSEDK